jgi:HK97 family phage major capsid protein
MTAKELREQRAQIAAKIGALNAAMQAAGEFTAEQQAEWDKLDGEYKGFTRRIDVADRAETIGAEQRAPIGDPQIGRDDYDPRRAGGDPARAAPFGAEEQRALAIQAWFRRNASDPRMHRLTPDHVAACEALGFDPNDKEIVIQLYDTPQVNGLQEAFTAGPRAMAGQRARQVLSGPDFRATLSGVGVAAGGALMAPEVMVNQLEIATLQYGGILQACEIMRTDGRERIRWPTAKDTGNKGRRLGESQAVAQLDPAFGEVFWDAYKYTSDEIYVPYELLTGTPFDLPTVLGDMMGMRIGRKFSDDGTTGTGANQPKGVVTAAGTYSAPSATAIAWDDLQDLISSVDPSYRFGAAFMFHDTIRQYLMKLKDGIGRPLWPDGPNGTEPALLRGYPWFINQSQDSTIASGKKTIGFGQYKKYKVRQIKTLRIYRLIERARENDQDIFLAFQEMDGNLLDAGGTPIKYLTH